MKRIPKEIGKGAGDLSVDDLIAGEMKQDVEKAEEAEKGRSERGPPKKKNRIEISSHSSNNNTTETDKSIINSSSSSSDLLTPTGPTIPSAPNANGQSTSTSTSNSTRNRNNTNNTKSKTPSEELHDGRRAMYVAPMRKRWYREWTVLRGNRSTWDEKVLWRRIGGPLGGTAKKFRDAERSGDAEITGGRGAAVRDEDGDGDGNGDGSRDNSGSGNGNGHGGGGGDAEPPEKGPNTNTATTAENSKDPSTEWDEIYQISSVNHHVAIMKMRVSRRYLRWLETGDVEGEGEDNGKDGRSERRLRSEGEEEGGGGMRAPHLHGDNPAKEHALKEGNEADVLSIQRSPWFDMFDVDARKEFLVGLWRVMCWLCRDEVSRG
jgi:hypothetical protein